MATIITIIAIILIARACFIQDLFLLVLSFGSLISYYLIMIYVIIKTALEEPFNDENN